MTLLKTKYSPVVRYGPMIKKVSVWLCRLAVGATLVFSGFVKGADPWGTMYKFREYLEALNLSVPYSVLLTGVVGLCALEFVLGCMLALGCYRRRGPQIVFLFMCFMLLLTLWIALADPISDCGCFGDVLTMGNWATFGKNVVLVSLSWILLRCNRMIPGLIRPALQWLALMGCSAYIAFVAIWGYDVQPLCDFRPFPTGTVLGTGKPDDDLPMAFVYRRGAETVEVTADDIQPSEEDGWVFIERRELQPAHRDGEMRIYDIEEGDDMTEALTGRKLTLLILVPEADTASQADVWRVTALARQAPEEGVGALLIVAGSDSAVDRWRQYASGLLPVYTADDTVMKMVARGNPSLVMLDEGKILWKSALAAGPRADAADDLKYTDALPEAARHATLDVITSYSRDDKKILHTATWLLAALTALLAAISGAMALLPRTCKKASHAQRASADTLPTHDDTALPS